MSLGEDVTLLTGQEQWTAAAQRARAGPSLAFLFFFTVRCLLCDRKPPIPFVLYPALMVYPCLSHVSGVRDSSRWVSSRNRAWKARLYGLREQVGHGEPISISVLRDSKVLTANLLLA